MEKKDGVRLDFETNRETGLDLLSMLKQKNIPVASSCRGEGVCCKCIVEVVEGEENLSIPNELENFLKEQNQWPDHFRLSCQTRLIRNHVVLRTNYWSST